MSGDAQQGWEAAEIRAFIIHSLLQGSSFRPGSGVTL